MTRAFAVLVVEVGVALDDRALAVRICNELIETYFDRRHASGVRILDRCAPVSGAAR